VQLTNNSAAPPVIYTLLFEIAVIKCDKISVAPTVLPPVVVGTAYTQNLVAKGANSSFTWSVISSSLPPGLTWDTGSHQLSGTVTDATQVGNAFSLVLRVAASDVIMDPLPVSLGITVQSGAAVASNLSPWAIRLIALGSGLAFMGIAILALHRLLAGKADPKTAEAVTEGNQIIEQTTNGKPKSVGQIIVQLERARTEILLNYEIPELLRRVKYYDRVRQDYINLMVQGDKDIEKLENYVEKHPGAKPDDAVDDPDLPEYKKFSDLETGIRRLENLNGIYELRLRAITTDYNSVKAEAVANGYRIDEGTKSESENEHYLALE